MSCSFSADPKESRRQAMTSAIMVHADPTFIRAFYKWFRRSLYTRQQQTIEQEGETGGLEDNQEKEDEALLFDSVRKLGWIRSDSILQQPLGEALHQTILVWVKNAISKEFEVESMYDQCQEYKKRVILPWLEDLVGPSVLQDEWSSRLDFAVSECFCLVRMEEIFELVAEYPDSHTAVVELKKVLEITRMHQAMARALKTALVKRLNHPGANTSQIIDVYINTIKVFREIDPSDRLLQVVRN
ncbi:MAG: anaphase-promoting complex subunit 2 [Bacillariaceae sp.]